MPPQTLQKAGRLLDLLADHPEASAARLAELTGEPRSSVYRLLEGLRELELVEPGTRRGSFRLGLELVRLGGAVLSRFDERQAALPAMERLHERTGQTVHLVVARGREAVCIERIEGRDIATLAMRLGSALPLHVGGAPRALLAWLPEDARGAYLADGPLEALTPATITDPVALAASLQATREAGVSVSDEDVTVGVASIGAPVFGFDGRARAAISIGGTRAAVLGPDRERLITAVRAAAREASAALGAAADERPHRAPAR
ncbi:MAG TPA: IclR family transcriptional regulator [Capillimicrobium sp.]|jgi:DNA-binding IclR family transcriptional regulator